LWRSHRGPSVSTLGGGAGRPGRDSAAGEGSLAGVRHRYDDPAFGVSWPVPVTAVSDKDAGWPAFDHDGNAATFRAGVQA